MTLAAGVLESSGLIGRLDDRSWLLMPRAERAVRKILTTRASTNDRGQAFMLRMLANETSDHARAVIAQCRQTRAGGRRASRLDDGKVAAARVR